MAARWRNPLLCFALALAVFGGATAEAWAQASSGGYSRPSLGAEVRRPPVSSGGSGGYARPSFGGGGFSSSSAGDRALSRRSSSDALSNYRAQQRASEAPQVRRPSPWGAPDSGYAPPLETRRPSGYGWPSGPSRSGMSVWDAAAAWALLNALTAPNRTGYFQDHRNDPGYQQWRQEAERAAQRDPTVAANLQNLDAQLARPQPPVSHDGSGLVWVVVLAGGALLVGLWLMRRRSERAEAAPPGAAAGRFRVGMVIPADPTPFLLAAGTTKVHAPEGGSMFNVEAVGTLRGGPVFLQRLYLAGGGFFQLHLGADGAPDECRYFSQIDEVVPATADEWRFWLDPAGGTIGWPVFQTKDGKSYDRIWNAGTVPVAPIAFDETIESTTGAARRSHQAMLYGARTGAAPPGPQSEYVLVDAVEEPSGASVGIHAGIDVNPAALNLAAVPLT